MFIKHTFKQLEASDAVKFHAEERFKKLLPHLTKQDSAHVVYKKVRRHEFWVDITITGHNKTFQASAKSKEDFNTSLDTCIAKLAKQLSKKKDKLQHHRHAEMSRLARLDRMSEDMEHHFHKISGAGSNRQAA